MIFNQILDALGDGTRRTILSMVRDKSRSVGEIAEALPVSQPAVSQHLKVLRNAGLVRAEKLGRKRIYHVDKEGFEPLREYVSSFWDEALDAFQDSFQAPAKRRKQ